MSVYKIVEIVGTSPVSWEDAVKKALATAAKTVDELRIAEVVRQDVTIENGKVTSFRVRLSLSFKYHKESLGEHFDIPLEDAERDMEGGKRGKK